MILVALLLVQLAASPQSDDRRTPPLDEPRVLEDFQSYTTGDVPTRWKRTDRSGLIPVTTEMSQGEFYAVYQEGKEKYLRMRADAESARILFPNNDANAWDMNDHPSMSWKWRAHSLPRGAREDEEKLNDAGAAVYVTFSVDFLGRPRSIKYTYSSTLPVGTVVDYGRLKVVVASSGMPNQPRWIDVKRNVAEDYRRLFGSDPPSEPLSIGLASDSDSVKGLAEVDFDDITLLSK